MQQGEQDGLPAFCRNRLFHRETRPHRCNAAKTASRPRHAKDRAYAQLNAPAEPIELMSTFGNSGLLGSPIKHCPSGRDQLQKVIKVADVGCEDGKAHLLCLQKKNTVVKRPQARIFFIALKAAQHAGKKCCPSQHVRIRRENSVRLHVHDGHSDLPHRSFGPWMFGIQDANSVHQLLNSHGRMIAHPDIQQIGYDIGRTSLQAVDIDTRIEKKILAAVRPIVEEREFIVPTSSKSSTGVEASPADRSVEIKVRQFRNPASDRGLPCLASSGTWLRNCRPRQHSPMRIRSDPCRFQYPYVFSPVL